MCGTFDLYGFRSTNYDVALYIQVTFPITHHIAILTPMVGKFAVENSLFRILTQENSDSRTPLQIAIRRGNIE